jgi:formylglycine-generating enzyme
MKRIFFVFLIVLITIALTAELNQLRIVGQAEKTQDIVPARYETVNREKAACIIFVTDLAVDLDFRPRIALVGLANPAPGQFHVYVDPSERVIDVHALGYRPLPVVLREFGISRLRSGDVYKIELTGDKPDVRSIENINIVVNTDPRNAIVYLNDKGVEDSRQILAPMGKNTLRIELDGYKSIIDEIEVSEQRTLFEYRMELAMDVPVRIETNPAGATVFLDDVNCGTTPLEFFYQEGDYRLRIVSDNHAAIEEIIEVREPQTVKSYILEDIRGSLTIKTGPNSRIFINNEAYPQGVTNLKLPPQLTQIRITTPKAQDITRSVVVREKEHQELELYPQIDTGTIGVSVMPLDAQVELTGDSGERFSSQGSQTFRDVPIGMYELEIKADKHKTHKESFEVKKDEVIRKQVILEEGPDVLEGMVFVEGGTFQMGSNDGKDSEKPIHSVTVSDFYIGKFEVTQREWSEVMGVNPSGNHSSIGDPLDHPINAVSWYNAIEFCNKLSISEGLTPVYSINGNTSSSNWTSGTVLADWNANGYRLPTEAEWEYAARGGNKSRDYTYSGSNSIRNVACYGDYGWDSANKSPKGTKPVGTKLPNELGIYDMSGNVWEWSWDFCGDYSSLVKKYPDLLPTTAIKYGEGLREIPSYGDDTSSANEYPIVDTNPRGARHGTYRVRRGGSWGDIASICTVSFRYSNTPSLTLNSIGFRVVRKSP